MPRIEAIRIAGLRYNKMMKRYEDLLLDLSSTEETQHALFTLVNGGGKGALLQTLFQVMLPGTSWGPVGERKYQHFFYNNKKQFMPYTFHVAIEWRKDTQDEQYITTGIVATAEKKLQKKETETASENEKAEYKIVPKYTLYTSEYTKPTEEELAQLPFSNEHGEILSYMDAVQFLKQNKRIEIHTRKDYHSYLQSFGIAVEEWEIMRGINKEEGGVKDYFKDSLDNMSLFHKKIIPSISQQLNISPEYGEENSLLEIFKHQASIAQNLPQLIKQEYVFKELLQYIVPFEDTVAKGMKQLELQQYLYEEGQQLTYNLGEVINDVRKDLQDAEQEQGNLEQQCRELSYNLANADYVEYHQNIEELQGQRDEKEGELQEAKETCHSFIQKQEQAHLNVLLKKWSLALQNLQETLDAIDEWKNKSEFQDTEKELEEAERAFQKEWEVTKENIISAIAAYRYEEGHYMQQEKELSKHKEAKVKQLHKLQIDQGVLQNKLTDYETKLPTYIAKYGERIEQRPDLVYAQLQKEAEKLESERGACIKQIEQLQQSEKETGNNEAAVKEAMKSLQKNIKETENQLENQLKKEKDMLEQLSEALLQEMDSHSKLDFQHAQTQLQRKIQDMNHEIQQVRREMWKVQLDASLHEGDYLNDDIKLVQDSFHEQGIYSVSGVAFLQSLSEEEQNHELEKNLLLRYGIVMLQEDWKKVRIHLLEKLTLRSLVPIFVRQDASSTTVFQFQFANDQTFHITIGDKWKQWKEGAVANIEKLQGQIHILESAKEKHDFLREQVKLLLSTSSSEDIQLHLKELLLEKEEKQKQIEQIQAKILEIQHNIKQKKDVLAQLEAKLDATKTHISEVKIWVKSFEEHKIAKNKLIQLLESIKRLELEVQELTKGLDAVQQKQNEGKIQFYVWLNGRREEVKEFLELDHTIHIPEPERVQPSKEGVFSAENQETARLREMFQRWQKVKSQQVNIHAELAKLEERKIFQSREVNSCTEELEKASESWRLCPVPQQSLEQLEREAKGYMEETERIKHAVEQLNTVLYGLKQNINQTLNEQAKCAKRIRENHEREASVQQIENLEEFKIETKQNLNNCKNSIEENRNLVNLLYEQLQKLEECERLIAAQLDEPVTRTSINTVIIQQLRTEPRAVTGKWLQKNKEAAKEREGHAQAVHREYIKLKQKMEQADWESGIKAKLLNQFQQMDYQNYSYTQAVLNSMKAYANHTITELQADLHRAKEAQRQWVDRAVMKCLAVSEQLKIMLKKMSFKNEAGYDFPLVRLDESKSRVLAFADTEQISLLLEDYFQKCIKQIQEEFGQMNIEDSRILLKIKELMSDEQIVFAAMCRRYPTLLVYNLQTTNAFQYDSPKSAYYSPWETINKGSDEETSGSGGQTLSARMMIMMMLLSFKKQSRHVKKWTTLISDNPFGQAVSTHILDPIFALASLFHFQWIVVSPPELIKTSVSQRFNTYYQLELVAENGIELVRTKNRKYTKVYN